MTSGAIAIKSATLVLAVIGAGSSASGVVVPIYGSPTYDWVTDTGYSGGGAQDRGGVGKGFAVGEFSKRDGGKDLGSRPFRWDAHGNVREMEILGASATGYTRVAVSAVNEAGVVVGMARKYFPGGTRDGAVRWNDAGFITELGDIQTSAGEVTSSSASAVNDTGTAVGSASRSSGTQSRGSVAVRWVGTTAQELGALSLDRFGFPSAGATAVNHFGTTIGGSKVYGTNGRDLGSRAVRWNANSTAPIELGNLGFTSTGFSSSRAYAINFDDIIVGSSDKIVSGISYGERAVRWTGTTATELGTLGTNPSGTTVSIAYDINRSGTVVGSAWTFNAAGENMGPRAVRWDASGTAATELGHLDLSNGSTPGVASCEAIDINDAGIAVGTASRYDGSHSEYRAALWGLDNVAIDLDALLSPEEAEHWTLSRATSINESSWVSGYGYFDPDGIGPIGSYTRAFLLDAIRLVGVRGDATRDNRVGFDDLVTLAQHYNQATGQTWDAGDFTGDAAVTFDDLVILAQHYNTGPGLPGGFSADFAADWLLAQALAPEPGAAMLIVASVLAANRRRLRSVSLPCTVASGGEMQAGRTRRKGRDSSAPGSSSETRASPH